MSQSPSSAPTPAPMLPLPRGTVFLPGVAHRLPIAPSRLDIPALVSAVYHQAAKSPDSPLSSPTEEVPSNNKNMPMTNRIKTVPIICVPHRSPLIGRDGQLLIQSSDLDDGSSTRTNTSSGPPSSSGDNLAEVDSTDFFGYATVAKIIGFEGNPAGELGLVIEAVGRVKMSSVTQEVPHFEGLVEHVSDNVPLQDPQVRDLFTLLKTRSAELITIHIQTLISRPQASGPAQLANIKRVGTIVKTSQLKDAGMLADLMVSVIDSTYEEKLQLLATLEVKPRVAKAIELLERQIDDLKHFLKVASMAAVPIRIVNVNGRQPPSRPPLPSSHMLPPPGSSPQFDDQDSNELEELRRKLDAAKLPEDAAKMVAKELKRLQKMAPANQEYQVVRNWLDAMVEIPWSTTTPDRLDSETLVRARAQLDGDHYGLDSVKKRLVEYLAVLRLKKSVSDDVQAQIKKLEHEVAQHQVAQQGALAAGSARVADVTDESQPVVGSDDALAKSKQALEGLRNRRVVDKSPILLLAGPPGVGKTSLAKSVATALGRKFHRISLGGVRDEAEIRGHRRTYVAALPGILVQALRKVGVANPVILLDEIDKLAPVNNNGDPSAALLEVLDPEQNHTFTDHYVGTPVDLSKVLFIATANDLGTIPGPLLDRLETINLPGYTTIEKRHIAMQHLIPKQIVANGLGEDAVLFSDDVSTKIIESYTRESGVRNLEREISAVCRHKAVEYAEAKDNNELATYRPRLTLQDVEAILGPERFEEEVAETSNRPGIVTGLVAYSYGGAGSILFIEVADMPGDGGVQLTGQLGSVLQESVSVALSWVKGHAFELGLTQDPSANVMQDRSIHVHCPSGSIPKDGPSSGIAQAIALMSLFSDRPVPSTLAMTGEISLRGRVLPVGGIKEKLIGALRAGIKTAIVPAQNRRDVADLPQEVKDGIDIYPVSHISEAIRLVWPEWRHAADPAYAGFESHI